MNLYEFEGVRFIPHYRDFDFDDFTVRADSVTEAWELLDKYTKRYTWKSVGLTHINGKKITPAITE